MGNNPREELSRDMRVGMTLYLLSSLYASAEGVVRHLTALRSLYVECCSVHSPIASPSLQSLELSAPHGSTMKVRPRSHKAKRITDSGFKTCCATIKLLTG